MKPRPVKLTRAPLGRPPRPGPQRWDIDEPTTLDGEDPEGKTPVVPAPTLWMLAHASASWYSRYRSLLVGIGAVLLVGVAFLVSLRLFSGGPAAQAAAEPAVPAHVRAPVPPPPVAAPAPAVVPVAEPAAPPAAAAPAVSETIVLSVTVSPSSAVIFIDGEPVPSNPFLSRFPRSVDSHRVRAVAAGHKTKERLVSFADNVMLDLSLSPLPSSPASSRERSSRKRESARAAPPPPPAPAPVAAPPAASAPAAEATVKPDSDKPRRRRIDSTDPYSEDRR